MPWRRIAQISKVTPLPTLSKPEQLTGSQVFQAQENQLFPEHSKLRSINLLQITRKFSFLTEMSFVRDLTRISASRQKIDVRTSDVSQRSLSSLPLLVKFASLLLFPHTQKIEILLENATKKLVLNSTNVILALHLRFANCVILRDFIRKLVKVLSKTLLEFQIHTKHHLPQNLT